MCAYDIFPPLGFGLVMQCDVTRNVELYPASF